MLSDTDRLLYARQVLLAELGLEGQERLCSTALAFTADADSRARDVACDYLERGGVGTRAQDSPVVTVSVATRDDVARVAGEAALEAGAAWLLGAFAAVEAIKASTGAGTPSTFPSDFVLGVEVR